MVLRVAGGQRTCSCSVIYGAAEETSVFAETILGDGLFDAGGESDGDLWTGKAAGKQKPWTNCTPTTTTTLK